MDRGSSQVSLTAHCTSDGRLMSRLQSRDGGENASLSLGASNVLRVSNSAGLNSGTSGTKDGGLDSGCAGIGKTVTTVGVQLSLLETISRAVGDAGGGSLEVGSSDEVGHLVQRNCNSDQLCFEY
jgi:hypothetical protein